MHLRLLKKKPSHEEVFLEHYSSMLVWAKNLSRNDIDLAEDLVQEAYIQFTLTAPNLSEIHNLDGYLYGLLRNLCLSHFRRVSRNRLEQLSIYEYDSAEDGLNTVEMRDQENARDDLQKICSFLSFRKNSARTASVFILRFFHGYFAGEIAAILRTSRPAVDVRLMTARKEVRAFLENPQDVKFIGVKDSLKQIFQAMPVQTVVKQDEFLSQLRSVIFTFREGEHQSKEQLQEFYEKEQASTIDVGRLSHLVSCPKCLDEVNLMLKLPKLSSRFPTDSIKRDKKKGGNDNDSDGTSGSGMSKLGKRLRRVFEHKPTELRVVVNGALQGSLKVNAELNELKLNLSDKNNIEFIEIFSEQQVRLLILNVEEMPPVGANNQSVSLTLSDERQIDLQLNFIAQGAELQLIYHDPTFNQVMAMLANPALIENEVQPMQAVEKNTIKSFQQNWWKTIFRFNFSPKLAVAALSILLIATVLFVRFPFQSVSASELLKRSAEAEKSIGRVLRKQILISGTSFNNAKGNESKTIQEWTNADRSEKIRRIFNESGELVVINKISGNKISNFVSDKAKPMTIIPIASPQMAKMQRAWNGGLSAQEFKKIIGDPSKAAVEEKTDSYLINYSEGEFKTTLVLEKDNLRPIKQILDYQINGKSYHFEFTETNFETYSPDSVNADVFAVDENFHETSSRTVE